LYYLAEPVGRAGRAQSLIQGGNVASLMPAILQDIQNRGQLAAGITSYAESRPKLLDTFKDLGSVAEAFRMNHRAKHQAILRDHAGRAAIGHVRYATCGADDVSYAQPFERHHGRRWKWFSFAFNGNIANYAERKKSLLDKQHYHIVRDDSDTEIIMHALSYALRGDSPPRLLNVMRSLSKQFDGAYNVAFINAMGDMFVARDPLGLRPMCYAVEGRLFAAASESVALSNLGFKDVRDVEPGTMVVIEKGRLRVERFAPAQRHAHCFFEWVYFSNVASTMDGTSVYMARARLGERMAEREDQTIDDNCIVVPVPDTAKATADSMAYHLGIPSMEGLIRNRYVGRTFIEGRDGREEKARRKYAPIPAVLGGRRVFLVEDSLVRATTLKVLLRLLRERGGAKEIHIRIGCPPIIAPCFYGIDMSTLGELYAPAYAGRGYRGNLSTEASARMAAALGADTLRYVSVDDIADGIRVGKDQLCLGCVTGKYPTAWGNRLMKRARANAKKGRTSLRTY
jgi:amidophosphoribosyltransferase